MSSKVEDIILKHADYYSSHGVQILKRVKITKVDTKNKIVLSSDQKLGYDKLFLATGSRSVSSSS
jgi:NAD(P)H-nitrite reductase large subunit